CGTLGRWSFRVSGREEGFRPPASEDVARFVGVETLLDCRVRAVGDGVVVLEAGRQTIEVAQPAEAGEWVRLCVRPEDVTLSPRAPAGARSSARNHLDGAIVRLAPRGPHVRVTIDCGFPLVALVTQRSVREMALEPGTQVTAHFKATAPHLLHHAKPWQPKEPGSIRQVPTLAGARSLAAPAQGGPHGRLGSVHRTILR